MEAAREQAVRPTARKLVCLHKLSGDSIRRIREAAPEWEIVCNADKETLKAQLPHAEIIAGWNEQALELVTRKPRSAGCSAGGPASIKCRWRRSRAKKFY